MQPKIVLALVCACSTVFLSSPSFGGADLANKSVIDDAGRLYLKSHKTISGRAVDGIWRFFADGSPDLSFGGGGKIRTGPTSQSRGLSSFALAADGIVAGGQLGGSRPDTKFYVTKFDYSGQRDRHFGSAPGMIGATVVEDCYGSWASVQMQGDKILIACPAVRGGISLDAQIVRLSANGSVDPSFGYQGSLQLASQPHVLESQYIVASLRDKVTQEAQLVKLLPHGQVDSSFTPSPMFGAAMRILFETASGDLVGSVGQDLVKLKSDGRLDLSFGTNGYARVSDQLRTAAQYPDGSIGVLSNVYSSTSIHGIFTKFQADGSIDTGFGSAGSVRLDDDDTGREWLLLGNVWITDNNRALISGQNSYTGDSNSPGTLMAIDSDGNFDPLFAGDGFIKL